MSDATDNRFYREAQPPSNELTQEREVRRTCGHLDCKGKGTYSVAVSCTNCGWTGRLALTKGHEFTRWAEPCPGCGCDCLQRSIV